MINSTEQTFWRRHAHLAGVLLIAALGIAHLVLTNVYEIAVSNVATPAFKPYSYLIAAFVVAVALAAWTYSRSAKSTIASRPVLLAVLACALGGFALTEMYLWGFDLDDKWIYYRMSRNVLTTGLPLWNANEMALVGASFVYPYLVSLPNLLGDWPVWDLYQRVIGIAFTLAIGALVLRKFGLNAASVLCVSAILLYEPLSQWSIGGMETSFATLWLVAALLLYLFKQGNSLLFWFLLGALIYIRPDAILIGVGAFVARFVRGPMDVADWLKNGVAFSLPIITFMVQNQVLFGFPLPLVFLVKGWNCAYCGYDPLYEKIFVGLLHNLSGFATSALITLFSCAGVWRVLRGVRLGRTRKAPVVVAQPLAFDLYAGLGVFMVYHVIGGYQHMNFTFRYWIPGIIGMVVVSLYALQNSGTGTQLGSGATDRLSLFERIGLRSCPTSLLWALFVLQFSQTALATYQARHYDFSLTIAAKRDRMSTDSYATYLVDWFQAGIDLRAIGVKPTDKLYLMQGMLTGAMTEGYLVDQFYFPPTQTQFPELRSCKTLPWDSHACDIYYDYVITFADKKYWPETHESIKEYKTIAVLRRKNYPIPPVPVDLKAVRIAAGTFDFHWDATAKGETRYDLEVSTRDAKGATLTRTEWVQPVGRRHRIDMESIVSGSARIRACNDKGCSDWTEANRF